jgi:Uma2 family endonuclease
MQTSTGRIESHTRPRYPYDEYLALEAFSNVKHEYLDGVIYALPSGAPEEAALAAAVAGLLFPYLRGGPCRLYGSSLRVRTLSGLATYPDVTVICGASERYEADADAITNPVLIVEVQSRNTEEYDVGEKFEHYKTLRTLREYLLVSHREHSLVVWTRADDGQWRTATVREGDVAELHSIEARLDVRELYAAAEPSR